MSISSLTKVNIYFHNENKKELVKKLQELACLHIVDFKETYLAKEQDDLIIAEDLTDYSLEKEINELNFAIRCLTPFEKRTGFLNMLAGKRVLLSKKEYTDTVASFDEIDIVKTVRDLEKEEHTLLTEITNNEAAMRELRPWKSLTVNIEEIRDTDSTLIRLGRVPANKLSNLIEKLDSVTELYELKEVSHTAESVYILVACLKEYEDEFEDALTINSFERKDFKRLNGRISDIIASYVKRDDEDDARLAVIASELLKHAVNLPKLKVKFDHLYNEYQKSKVEQNFGRTDNVSLIVGFVDKDDLPELKEVIEAGFKEAQIEEVETRADEQVPTKLKNKNSATRSFELVLDMYGMPSSKSFDSTVYLMPFFAVFFGLCLTDGGYGLVLALFSIYFIKKYKPIFGKSKLMWMLFICGLTTMVAGAITGGWFGDATSKYIGEDNALFALIESMKLFDPLVDTMTFFGLSLVLGYIHILFGLIMSFVKFVKDGELIEGLCASMTWIAFLVTLLFWMLGMNIESLGGIATPAKYLFFVSCASIVVFSETGAASIGVRIASGLYNLYGASSYMGDLLSYLRLLALGLASGVIANVINEMSLLSAEIPYVGVIVAIIIFIGGHIFNLVLSGLGAFVHTLRLNYVEFFPKFFVGGGTIFRPFTMESQYMLFSDEQEK